jgi:hypothetical protein
MGKMKLTRRKQLNRRPRKNWTIRQRRVSAKEFFFFSVWGWMTKTPALSIRFLLPEVFLLHCFVVRT